MNIKEGGVLVQIGTMNGCDEFTEIVRNTKPAMIILVEPNELMLSDIKENYKDIDNVFIENVAITAQKQDGATLYIPICDDSGKADNGHYYGNQCWTLLPMNGWGETLREMKVDSMTLMELCEKHNITHIDYLQIDTEGYDAQIMASIDFNKVTIDIIKYELWEFRIEAYGRHWENARFYGINGQRYAERILINNGYVIEHIGNDGIAIKTTTA